MTRRVPAELTEKVAAVVEAVAAARSGSPRQFHRTDEVRPQVRLLMTSAGRVPVVFSLWTDERDIAEVCGDAAYPASSGLLAIDKRQLVELARQGTVVDLAVLVRSETLPGMYYVLLDSLSDETLRAAVERLVVSRQSSGERRSR